MANWMQHSSHHMNLCASGYILVHLWLLSDVSYSDKCWMEKCLCRKLKDTHAFSCKSDIICVSVFLHKSIIAYAKIKLRESAYFYPVQYF